MPTRTITKLREHRYRSAGRLSPWTLRGSLLGIGAFSQVGQVLIFREVMAVGHGTELMFGGTLAAGLAWSALGAFLGQIMVQNYRVRQKVMPELAPLIGFGMLISAPLLAAQILLIRMAAPTLVSIPGQFPFIPSLTLLTLIATAPLALLCGGLFALVLGCAPAGHFGRLYCLEGLGVILGGLWMTFPWMATAAPLRLCLLTGLLYSLSLLLWRPKGFGQALPALLGSVLFILLILTVLPVDDWSLKWQWQRTYPGHRLEAVIPSPYGRVIQLGHPPSGQRTFYLNGGLLASLESDGRESEARHLAMLLGAQFMAQTPRSVLLIGGTLGRLPRELLARGIEHLEVIELVPQVAAVGRRWDLLPADDPRLEVSLGDGRRLLSVKNPGSVDLAIVLLPQPDNILANRFGTLEFFQDLERVLTPRGVACLILPTFGSSPEYISTTLAKRSGTIYQALNVVFADTLVAPIQGHLFLAAKKEHLISLDPQILAARTASRRLLGQGSQDPAAMTASMDLPLFFSAIFDGALEKHATGGSLWIQGSDQSFARRIMDARTAPNRDGHPRAVAYSLALWKEIATDVDERKSPQPTASLEMVVHIMTDGSIAILLAGTLGTLLLLLLVGMVRKGRTGIQIPIYKPAVGLGEILLVIPVAMVTGFFGMVTVVVLMTTHQSLSGYVYSQVGLLTGLFMAGLVLGAAWADRWGATSRPAPAMLFPILAAMAILCLLLPAFIDRLAACPTRWHPFVWLAAVLVFSGFLDGATFPLLQNMTGKFSQNRPGAFLYGADLMGACMGALLTSAILLPTLGSRMTLYVAALVILVPLAVLTVGCKYQGRRQTSRPEIRIQG